MTGTYYRPDQAILSATWPPYVLDGPQGLRNAIEQMGLRTLSDLSGAWHTSAEKLRNLLGNAPSKAAAIKAVLAKVGPAEKEEAKADPDPVSAAASQLVRDRVTAPAQKAQPEWPPRMPRSGTESEFQGAVLDRKDRVLALVAKGKTNAEAEKVLGLSKNYVSTASHPKKDPIFRTLLEKARKGAEDDPQASAVTEKLPPRPEREPKTTGESGLAVEVQEVEVEDGPADHLAVPGDSCAPARCFTIPLDGTRDAELLLPQGAKPADIEAISEYLEFLSRRLAKGRR